MKFISKSQAEQRRTSDYCFVTEYPLKDKDINVAVVELTGRYPTAGSAVNLKCKELAYVIKGSGSVVVEDQKINLKGGDTVLVEPGEKFFWEGTLTLLMPSTPAWYPEQYKKIA